MTVQELIEELMLIEDKSVDINITIDRDECYNAVIDGVALGKEIDKSLQQGQYYIY